MPRLQRLREHDGESSRGGVDDEVIGGHVPRRVAVGVDPDDHDIVVHRIGKDGAIECEEDRERGGGEHRVRGPGR